MRIKRSTKKTKVDDRRRGWDDWQRYVQKETQRLMKKGGKQVHEFNAGEPAPQPSHIPTGPDGNDDIFCIDGQEGEIHEKILPPPVSVPREEAIQVSDDAIGRTVKPFTVRDYRNIKPLTSSDIFGTSEDEHTVEPTVSNEPSFHEESVSHSPESVQTIVEITPRREEKTPEKPVVTRNVFQEPRLSVPETKTEEKEIKSSRGRKKKHEEELGLFTQSASELQVAGRQRLTKKAKLEREELVDRLLDPVISLEETATLIGVCKTTVRRYTNKGQLECIRTPGQQRR
ncbi:MAG: hypothetical protein ABIC40_05810, partial [bacterium]